MSDHPIDGRAAPAVLAITIDPAQVDRAAQRERRDAQVRQLAEERIAQATSTVLTRVLPWLEPAGRLVTSEHWTVKFRHDVMVAAGRKLVDLSVSSPSLLDAETDAGLLEEWAQEALGEFIVFQAALLAARDAAKPSADG